MSLLVLSAADVDAVAASFIPAQLQLLMARVFAQLSASSAPGRDNAISTPGMGIAQPPRTIIDTGAHTVLFMPARIGAGDEGATAIKVVSVPHTGSAHGLPATTLVLDEHTGCVRAVVNARRLTALRNAAGSLLSTTLVGPPTPSFIAAFGTGAQVAAHLSLHLRHFPTITTCTMINRTPNARALALQHDLAVRFPAVRVSLLTTADRAEIEASVRAAVIIVCATSATAPLFPSAWVRTGAHVILVGSYKPTMHEVDGALISRALPVSAAPGLAQPRLLVDSREACIKEAGELISGRVAPEQMVEIGELVPADAHGQVLLDRYDALVAAQRPHADVDDASFNGPVTIFKSVGVGLQDVAIAGAIVDRALALGSEKGIGTVVNNYDS